MKISNKLNQILILFLLFLSKNFYAIEPIAYLNSLGYEPAQKELASITGQSPIITKAKKANASFKLREGMSVGLKVTLRKSKMYEFIDRLINIALPRVRDFRGISDKSFDGKGNYSLGLKEQFIFPEIEYDTVDTPRGMDITIVTTAKTDDEARELLKNFNFPFVNAPSTLLDFDTQIKNFQNNYKEINKTIALQ